jgi:hypothetical protein
MYQYYRIGKSILPVQDLTSEFGLPKEFRNKMIKEQMIKDGFLNPFLSLKMAF